MYLLLLATTCIYCFRVSSLLTTNTIENYCIGMNSPNFNRCLYSATSSHDYSSELQCRSLCQFFLRHNNNNIKIQNEWMWSSGIVEIIWSSCVTLIIIYVHIMQSFIRIIYDVWLLETERDSFPLFCYIYQTLASMTFATIVAILMQLSFELLTNCSHAYDIRVMHVPCVFTFYCIVWRQPKFNLPQMHCTAQQLQFYSPFLSSKSTLFSSSSSSFSSYRSFFDSFFIYINRCWDHMHG